MLSVLSVGCTVRSWAGKKSDPGDRRKSAPSVTLAEEYRQKALLTSRIPGTIARLFVHSLPFCWPVSGALITFVFLTVVF